MEKESAQEGNGRLLGALLLGLGIGAALGLLFAPAKGSETRERVLEGSGEFADEVKNKINELLSILGKNEGASKDEKA